MMDTYTDGDIENEREERTFVVTTHDVDAEAEMVGKLEDMRESGYDVDWGPLVIEDDMPELTQLEDQLERDTWGGALG